MTLQEAVATLQTYVYVANARVAEKVCLRPKTLAYAGKEKQVADAGAIEAIATAMSTHLLSKNVSVASRALWSICYPKTRAILRRRAGGRPAAAEATHGRKECWANLVLDMFGEADLAQTVINAKSALPACYRLAPCRRHLPACAAAAARIRAACAGSSFAGVPRPGLRRPPPPPSVPAGRPARPRLLGSLRRRPRRPARRRRLRRRSRRGARPRPPPADPRRRRRP